MAKNEKVFFPQEGKVGKAIIPSTSSPVVMATVGAEGGKILGFGLEKDITPPLELIIEVNSIEHSIGYFNGAPNPAGTNLLINGMLPKDKNGNHYMNVPAGTIIKVRNIGGSITGSPTATVYYEEY